MLRKNYNNDPERKIKPSFCSLGVTDKCMLKCKICYKWQDTGSEKSPTLMQYKNFISNLRGFLDEGFKIQFGAGEVLLFDGLLDLVKFSSAQGFSTLIASNGWLIDEEMAKRIAGSGLNEITLSLDSLNAQTHDYLRGVTGAHCRVMAAIDYLKKNSPDIKIGINSIICDYNLGDLMPLLEWIVNNDKINSIFLLAITQPNNIEVEKEWWKGKNSCLWPKDTRKVCSFVEHLLKFKSTGAGGKIGNSFAQLEAFKFYFMHPERFVSKTNCNLGGMVHVNAFGDISFLCPKSGVLGNIKKKEDIKKIWFSGKANHTREKIAVCRGNCHFLINCFFGNE
ncbi:MAG: radical SAM protein [Candidatus Omnitrophota bacterium]|nr:radical SAM protein [Candidatus Omnitrophota bacterium]